MKPINSNNYYFVEYCIKCESTYAVSVLYFTFLFLPLAVFGVFYVLGYSVVLV